MAEETAFQVRTALAGSHEMAYRWNVSKETNVIIKLSEAEALVLADLLSRWSKRSDNTLAIEHQAEQRVLWDIEVMLERQLVAPFSADYQDLLNAARQVVQDVQ